MTKRQVEKLMISRQGKIWNTKPEQLFNEYQLSRGLNLVQNHTLPFVAENRQGLPQQYDFQCDFLRPTDSHFDVDYEIDGRGHKEKNDPWKDEVKAKAGLRVIHVPGVLCEKKWWPYLDRQLPMALLQRFPVVYLVA